MGYKVKDLPQDPDVSSSSSSSLSDALLFTTMSIIGLPVEVQVKDGSVYSGIFHTASIEKDYGIILKKARMIKKGKQDVKLNNGSIIDTLVVQSKDLVQVIAKGVMLPAEGIGGNIVREDVEAANGPVRSSGLSQNDLKVVKSSNAAPSKRSQIRSSSQNKNKNSHGPKIVVGEGQIIREAAAKQMRSRVELETCKANGIYSTKKQEASTVPLITVDEGQVGKGKSQSENNRSRQQFGARNEETLQNKDSTSEAILPQPESVGERHVEIFRQMPSDGKSSSHHVPAHQSPGVHDGERQTVVDTLSDVPEVAASSTAVNITSESHSNQCQSPNISVASTVSDSSTKEFKLNPGAKTFSPILVPRTAAPPPAAAATVTSMPYIQNRPTVVAVPNPQPEPGVNTFTPQPIKIVHYNNMVALNDVTGSHYPPGSHYPQPIIGHVDSRLQHMDSRIQPVRYAGHYAPLQAGPTYVHPNPQSVTGHRLGQLVYMHPVSHDVIQTATTPSPHPLFAHPQAHFPKQQGIAAATLAAGQGIQVCATPPPPYMVNNGQQPFALPVHVPLSQLQFPPGRPIPVPVPNSHFVSKFI